MANRIVNRTFGDFTTVEMYDRNTHNYRGRYNCQQLIAVAKHNNGVGLQP